MTAGEQAAGLKILSALYNHSVRTGEPQNSYTVTPGLMRA